MESLKAPESARLGGLGYQSALTAISLLLGGAMVLVPQASARILCMLGCIILALSGAGFILYYFVAKRYRFLRDRNFALGVLQLLLGVCGLLRLDGLSAAFGTATGFLTLLIGVMLLQDTVQLTVLGSRANILDFIFTLLTLFAAVSVITAYSPVVGLTENFPYLSLFLAGILSLLSLGITALAVRRDRKAREAAEAAAVNEPKPQPDSRKPEPMIAASAPEKAKEAVEGSPDGRSDQ